MARGWESKSVEQQQADLADQTKPTHPPRSRTQQKLNQKREGLLLARTNLLRQLELSTHPAHRRMLQGALAEIDKQLACFEQDESSPDT